jgi:hypothetical protein
MSPLVLVIPEMTPEWVRTVAKGSAEWRWWTVINKRMARSRFLIWQVFALE